jgi:hypothetical protein
VRTVNDSGKSVWCILSALASPSPASAGRRASPGLVPYLLLYRHHLADLDDGRRGAYRFLDAPG